MLNQKKKRARTNSLNKQAAQQSKQGCKKAKLDPLIEIEIDFAHIDAELSEEQSTALTDVLTSNSYLCAGKEYLGQNHRVKIIGRDLIKMHCKHGGLMCRVVEQGIASLDYAALCEQHYLERPGVGSFGFFSKVYFDLVLNDDNQYQIKPRKPGQAPYPRKGVKYIIQKSHESLNQQCITRAKSEMFKFSQSSNPPHKIREPEVLCLENATALALTMQYLAMDTLETFIKKNFSNYNLYQKIMIMLNIALALEQLHKERHMCHLDVKPDNILIKVDPDTLVITIKFVDFALAKHNMQHDIAYKHYQVNTNLATRIYLPPEAKYYGLATTTTDVYSLGVIMCFALNCVPPVYCQGYPLDLSLRDYLPSLYPLLMRDSTIQPAQVPVLAFTINQCLKYMLHNNASLRVSIERTAQLLTEIVDLFSAATLQQTVNQEALDDIKSPQSPRPSSC